jgi:PAS domain S-box-containing protein
VESLHESILNAMDFPVIIVSGEIDDLGRIVYINETAAKLHGYKKNELLNSTLMLLEDEKEFEKIRFAAEKIFSGEKIEISVIHRKKDGSVFTQ